MNRYFMSVSLASVALISACSSGGTTDVTSTASSTSTVGSGGEGQGGDGGKGGGSASPIESACAGLVKQAKDCAFDPVDYQACVSAEQCFKNLYRDDAEALLLTCAANADCNGGPCRNQVGATLGFTPASTAHLQRCKQFNIDCSGTKVKTELCDELDSPDPYWEIFDDAVFKDITPCFALACSQFDACVKEATTSLLSSCGGDLNGL
jgi:hypothetical protein